MLLNQILLNLNSKFNFKFKEKILTLKKNQNKQQGIFLIKEIFFGLTREIKV